MPKWIYYSERDSFRDPFCVGEHFQILQQQCWSEEDFPYTSPSALVQYFALKFTGCTGCTGCTVQHDCPYNLGPMPPPTTPLSRTSLRHRQVGTSATRMRQMRRSADREDADEDASRPLKFSIGSDEEDSAPINPGVSRHRHYPSDLHTAPNLTHMRIIRWLLRMFPRFLIILVVLSMVVAMLPGGWRVALCAANFLPTPSLHVGENITLIGHRGCEFPYPENTVHALKYAADLVKFVELDITVTKDGEVIAMHDQTFDRTTNGTGIPCKNTAAYVKSLVVKMPTRDPRGRIMQSNYCTKKLPNGQSISCLYRVPTLSQVFDELPKGTKYMLDVKDCYAKGVKAVTPMCTNCTLLMEGTKKAIAGNFIKPEQLIFTSTEPESLKIFQKNMPHGSGYALGMKQSYTHYRAHNVFQMMHDGHFTSASMYVGLVAVRPDLVQAFRKAVHPGDKTLHYPFAWTIRSELDFRLARCAGVSNLIVAEPNKILKYLSWNIGPWLRGDET